MKRVISCGILTLLCTAALSAHADPVTTGSLVRELTDLTRLTYFPQHSYKTLQFTSYDRRSNVPGGPGWFNNADGFGNSPIPPFEKALKKPNDKGIGEYLMADVQGPGALVKTWTANINGNIAVYLDDAKEPIFEGSASDFLHRPYDTFLAGSGVKKETLQGTFYQRDAGYCPIPFSKRCRVIWKGNPRQIYFYYVEIRKYKGQVDVQTFKPSDLATYREDIQAVAKVLADPDSAKTDGDAESFERTLKPGERSKPVEFKGPGAIGRLSLLLDAQDKRAALRSTIMHVSCDGWTIPQVQTPVGDFFAAAPGVNPYVSLPFTVQEDGQMISRFAMPFEKSIQIVFENLGDQPVTVAGAATKTPYQWDNDSSMHFYSRWRAMHDLKTKPSSDIPFVLANGKGRFIGVASLMMNPARGTHPGGSWWGEGDEKVYVDDDTFPSWFGTGSEDYYNYSWSAVDLFNYPFCGQPRNDGPGNRGFVSNYRFHTLDDQPFESRFSFYMELLSHTNVKHFSYACQSYYYGRPGIMDDHRPITPHDAVIPELPGPYKPLAVSGSRGATYLEPKDIAEGHHGSEKSNFWSEGDLMTWKPKKVGDTLKLTLPVEKAGKYQVRLCLAVDHRGGSVSATVDGKPFGFSFAGDRKDLYDSNRTMIRASNSNNLTLESGDHVVELKYEGGKNSDDPFVGIDFIWLQPVR